MNDNRPVVVSSSGVGFCSLLTIVFIVLKLCKVITWSWVWVLAPLWIPLGITVVLLVIALVIAMIASLIAVLID